MPDSARAEIEAEYLDLFCQADGDTRAQLMLLAMTLARKDKSLAEGVQAYGFIPRRSGDTDMGEPDFPLIQRLRNICPEDEAKAWGRLLVHTYQDGDRGRRDALVELMQRRLAC